MSDKKSYWRAKSKNIILASIFFHTFNLCKNKQQKRKQAEYLRMI